jgi:arylsulfatase A-like enzyme/Flp pilus assembly protein TadD
VSWSLGGSLALAAPNVLLITIDTLRADHVGCYGYKFPTTPHLDNLCRQGVRFTRAYTPAPITLPAHAALFTGMLPPQNQMRDFTNNRLPAGVPALAELLKNAGYQTGGFIGSMVLDSRFGLHRGFQTYGEDFDFNRLSEVNLDRTERKSSVVVDEALKWLEGVRGRPFFLWVHMYEPHDPYEPPEPYRSQHAGRPYDGEIAAADAQVGRLVEYLKQHQLEANTSIVVAGDHGEGLGEHKEKTHGFFIYDTTLRVPLVMKLAGGKAGVVGATVSLIDVAPTILRHLNLAVPAQMQGRSLLGAIGGRPLAETSLYAETMLPKLHFGWSDLRSVRRGKWKYIQAPRPELYDLSVDPGEKSDLAAKQPAMANALRAEVQKAGAPPALPPSKLPTDPALVERLKSLGYVAVSGGTARESNAGLADPKDRVELYELISGAMIESQRGNFRQSVEMLERAAQTEPDSFTIHYLQGINFYRLRNFDRALEEFKKVLAQKPDYMFGVYFMALTYAQKGDYPAAQVGFERTLQLDASNFSAEFNLGQALAAQRKPAEAIPHYERAVRLNPEYAQAYNGLGEAHLALGNREAAIAAFQKALAVEPRLTRAQQNLDRVLGNRR